MLHCLIIKFLMCYRLDEKKKKKRDSLKLLVVLSYDLVSNLSSHYTN